MQKLLTKLDRVLALILMVLMATIVVDVTWQVLSRFILGNPSSVTEEIARFLLIWIGLLGAAYAFRTHSHLGLDLFTAKMAPARRHVAEVFSQVMSFIFSAWVMVYGGVNLVKLQFDLGQTSAALEINMGYVYSVIPIAGVLICIYAIDNIFSAKTRLSASDAGQNPID
jgi:TRAP-type C4-dicarboxylate transport system, small permease component